MMLGHEPGGRVSRLPRTLLGVFLVYHFLLSPAPHQVGQCTSLYLYGGV
jgi:hypothetical protein